MIKTFICHEGVQTLARKAAERLQSFGVVAPRVYAIPRGGVFAAYAMLRHCSFTFVDSPQDADFIVDDLIDSGKTMKDLIEITNIRRNSSPDMLHLRQAPRPIVLINKQEGLWENRWIIFPWEGNDIASIEDNIIRMLQYVGEDPKRGGLEETPARVARAWQHWCKGYNEDPATILKVFEDGAEGCNEMVVIKDIPFHSHCEHHMAPFFGRATIAYIPNGKIVGLSKFNRLVDCFARRLQVQERLTTQIADSFMEHVQPLGCGVLLKARHMCVESRGVAHSGCATVTSALRGVFKQENAVRQEFLALANTTKEP